LDQPQIFVNNLAIRRATEELKVARDYDQVRRILLAAFGSNDFDGFELQLNLFPGEWKDQFTEKSSVHRDSVSFSWSKPGLPKMDPRASWKIGLYLVTSSNRNRGRLTLHRLYSSRDLQLDVNLLAAAFPTTLADALDRTLAHSAELIAIPEQ